MVTQSNDGWGRQLASLESIPLDIVYLVADHCSVKDLVALSTVSKPLQNLLSDPGVWKMLYRKNAFLLPPGPYSWQSTSCLTAVLSRAEKLHSVWPSSWSCPEILRTHFMRFGSDATVSVVFGRWLLVADESTLVCYDSQCSNILGSARTLLDTSSSRRIFRVFSAGSVREEGIQAFAVLIFKDSFTITKVLMDQGQPSGIQTVFTSAPFMAEGWTDLVDVRLHHRLLVVSIGECSSDWESSGRLVLMDIDTLRRYHILASTDDPAFDPMHTVTFFFATKTHLVKATESGDQYPVKLELKCFPLPSAHETVESDILYPSHRSGAIYVPKMRQYTVIHDSSMESGKTSFVVCGLALYPDGNRLDVMRVCLEPDGSISSMSFGLSRYLVTSFCFGSGEHRACGVTLGTDTRLLVFALDFHGPDSFLFKHFILDHTFPASDLVALDTFAGTTFFVSRSSHHTSVGIVDFTRDARKVEGRQPEYSVSYRDLIVLHLPELIGLPVRVRLEGLNV
ncbi:hypothetical protein L210DRAFT_3219462 [Boletus edulis BED1]|uniref:F-box domain-containing protein n=1 Tax=Boletus edulis BED1 TaxID=1328754 RepID=A0AAD4BFW9_BOLED|nr:hypothetical protein L210DRAFT_3219462 [Boletus edulis BED1]